MRVTVIGGTGNNGTATVARLVSDGHDVTTVARRLPRPDRLSSSATWRRHGLTTASDSDLKDLLRGADACVYAAWAIQPMRRRDYQERVGVEGLSRTIDACRAVGVRHLVALSSSGAYAPSSTPVEPVASSDGGPSTAARTPGGSWSMRWPTEREATRRPLDAAPCGTTLRGSSSRDP